MTPSVEPRNPEPSRAAQEAFGAAVAACTLALVEGREPDPVEVGLLDERSLARIRHTVDAIRAAGGSGR